MKSGICVSLDRQVLKNLEYQLDIVNQTRLTKYKKPISKSDFIQNLIVIGLIIETNKKEDIPKLLQTYFEDDITLAGEYKGKPNET